MDAVHYERIRGEINPSNLMSWTEKLWRLEFGQQHENYRRSALCAEEILRISGLEKVERIPFPADGRTVYQDKTMPLCWRASRGRLAVEKSPIVFPDPVVADYSRHPFHLVKGSVSTPPGGVSARLITWEQLFGGEDARGAMVIAPPDARDKKELYSVLCDFGALGMVYDWLGSRYETPDSLHWVNGWTEGPHWHIIKTDRPLIGFSVTPRTGDMLRNAARRGEVLVRAESDGENFEGEIDVVSGLVRGKDPRELWLLAHLYEPLSADNSSGAACAAEIARSINLLAGEGKIPVPDFSIRVVFGLEMYGFAAYAASLGGDLAGKVIGALNLDGVAVSEGNPVEASLSPPFTGFHGNYAAESLAMNRAANPSLDIRINESGMYSDDMFLSDSTTNVPTVWFHQLKGLWHNSIQDMDIIDERVFSEYARFCACWAYMASVKFNVDDIMSAFSLSKEKILRERARVKDGSSPVPPRRAIEYRLMREKGILLKAGGLAGGRAGALALEKAGELEALAREISGDFPEGKNAGGRGGGTGGSARSRRVFAGMPYDLSRAPRENRRILPGRIIYGPLSRVLSNMDGEKTLAQIIEEARWEVSLSAVSSHPSETGQDFAAEIGEEEVKKYIGAVEYLTGLGYLETAYESIVRKEDIITALGDAGVRPGDLLFVHGALSPFGHIEGGAETVIDALMEVLGETGTLIMPEFTRSFVYFDGLSTTRRNPRPFDIDRPEDVIVGEIPRSFLKRKGVVRSPHPTHSAAAAGPLARECVLCHGESDPPCGKTSPFARLLEFNGRLLWFGADLASTTFFHFMEEDKQMPYLAGAVCIVKDSGGSPRAVLTPRSLPGHRDFYSSPGENSKAYRKLSEKGLGIRSRKLGSGELKLIDAREMYSLCSDALDEDPALFLCDDEGCGFCPGARKKIAGGR